jgi:hypothetical protein
MISVSANPVRRALDFLAKMGLTVRDDPKRVIDPAERAWGEPAEGFALSIKAMPEGLSVVLRNVGTEPRTLVAPGWLAFYKIEIEAPPTPFGRALTKPGRQTERITATLAPGEMTETLVPVASLFAVQAEAGYRTRVSCVLPGGETAYSNTITFRA